jgi:CheY-like chemotaxis protein
MRLKPSVLVVDDCREVACILAGHLRGKGYHVMLAHDGAAALALLARKPVDCILLDLMMPVMTGMELLHELKRDPALAAIPVVLVSARVGEGRTHFIAERDADYSIGKPFTRREVLDAVQAALRTAPMQSSLGVRAPHLDPPGLSLLSLDRRAAALRAGRTIPEA